MPGCGFPNIRRLKKPSEFVTVYQNNQTRVKGQYFLILAFLRLDSNPNKMLSLCFGTSRVGVVVSKKVSNLAVQRNRIKHQVREQFRQNKQPDGFDFVVFCRPGAAKAENIQLTKELNYLWEKLHKRCATV